MWLGWEWAGGIWIMRPPEVMDAESKDMLSFAL